MNRMLAIYNGRNKKFRHDGDEFQREALGWSKAQPEPVELVDVRDGKIRAEIRKMTDGLDVLAIFDHGTPKGLPRMRESYKCVNGLAADIARVTGKITIVLYACSCGRGWWWNPKKNKRDLYFDANSFKVRDGYAVALGCELKKLGVDAKVFAHSTAGHTTRNPNVVIVGGIHNLLNVKWEIERMRWVHPHDPDWKQWVAEMKTEYRFTFWK